MWCDPFGLHNEFIFVSTPVILTTRRQEKIPEQTQKPCTGILLSYLVCIACVLASTCQLKHPTDTEQHEFPTWFVFLLLYQCHEIFHFVKWLVEYTFTVGFIHNSKGILKPDYLSKWSTAEQWGDQIYFWHVKSFVRLYCSLRSLKGQFLEDMIRFS